MKLIVAQLIKKLLVFCRTGCFFTLFTGTTGPPNEPHGSLFHSSLIFNHILILSSQLRLGLKGGPPFRVLHCGLLHALYYFSLSQVM